MIINMSYRWIIDRNGHEPDYISHTSQYTRSQKKEKQQHKKSG
jgi:hypothetical protein